MMWSPLVLCLCVGFALSAQNAAWNPQNHYVYHLRGRSLASVDQISNDYSGIFLKGELTIQPLASGNLGAKLTKPQYAKVHSTLEDGWETEIPDSQLSYQDLAISDRPFEIVMHNGAVRNIIVSEKLTNWEANVIKSVVSQLQLDTKAVNVIPSSINILTQDDSNTAVFKTMEETVTGVSETLYEIHPFPEYILQTKPWMVPHKELIQQGDVIEIQKTKNFTHSPQTPSYHAGLEGIPGYQPGNKIGDFVTRSSVSQAVITGSLKQFTIQSSVAVEDIVLSPNLVSGATGSLKSKSNVTLVQVAQALDQAQFEVDSPVKVGVVYRYDQPFSTDNSPRPGEEYEHDNAPSSAETPDRGSYSRSTRSLRDGVTEEDSYWFQEKPALSDSAPSPLLPFTVGYNGQSIKKTQNIIEVVRKLAEEIGKDYGSAKETLHQHTAGKYVTLISLIRILDQNEINQVATQLGYGDSPAWVAFRDAVAASGTGPAIYNIKQWIKSDKLSNVQAAVSFATAAAATRHPTEDYMKFLNEMIQDPVLMAKPYLNVSLPLSYTNLVHSVYGNRQYSHGKFPVYSFGSFRTERGQQYVKRTIIPYLSSQLNKAILDADSHKVHIYIRALGNIGQQEILEAFEPYLEGQKKASHFQRFLMVVALDKLAAADPQVARSVLYKIYQNPAEYEPVRVAAVYLLRISLPTAPMLQRMASYTNVDPSKYVNAAVKSLIEHIITTKLPEYEPVRAAAQSAKPLLTHEEYGAQYSQKFLRSYYDQEHSFHYIEPFQTFGGSDHAFPRHYRHYLKRKVGGVQQLVMTHDVMVSSFEDVVNVFAQQTKEYQRQKEERQAQLAQNVPWSSEYVAKLLGLDNEQREQLEGYTFMNFDRDFQHAFSMDNLTLSRLPAAVQKIEEELKQGKLYKFQKMLMAKEVAFAFPTVIGLPFLFTYDAPILVKSEIDLKLSAKPQISTGSLLQKPDVVEADFSMNAFITGKIQSQFGIFTPFDHQRYTAGYTRNYQLVVPVTGDLAIDVQKQQLKLKIQPTTPQQSVHLGHYSSWPYTAQNDIYAPKPNIKIIRKEHQHKKNIVIGEPSTGFAFYLTSSSDERLDLVSLYRKLSKQDIFSVALSPCGIQYVHIDVGLDGQKSPNQYASVLLSYASDYQQNEPKETNETVSDIPTFPEDPQERLKEFVKKLGAYIGNAQVYVADATVDFEGSLPITYALTAGVSKSNVDSHSRLMAWLRKLEKKAPKIVAYVRAVANVSNTNGLNLDYAMNISPNATVDLQGFLRYNGELSRTQGHVELTKSGERVEYLKQLPEYKECKQQMEKGNIQLPICARMTAEANFLDQFALNMTYDNMNDVVANATYKAYSVLRYYLFPRVDENVIDVQAKDRLEIRGNFSTDLMSLNASIVTELGRSEIKHVKLSKLARHILVPHPVFHVKSRLGSYLLRQDTVRPICVVDKTHSSTFDNRTFPSTLSNAWTVLLQYVPRRPSVLNKTDQTVLEQLNQTTESYVVYARAAQPGSADKEVQIVLQMPATQGKVAKIVMKQWREGRQPKVVVNDQEVKYTSEKSSDFYKGHIQIYALPNQEVKIEVYDAFYVIFNGQTLKITAVNSKFRDAARGICGTFTGEPETDFLAPDNCIVHTPEEFIQSYTVDHPGKLRTSMPKKECYQKKIIHANYISNQDAGRSSDYDRRTGDECTGHLSRYVEKDGEICFTIRALPYCKPGCRPLSLNHKKIDVNCMDATPNTAYWRAKIDQKINQDFTMMQPTEQILMHVPARCVA